MRIFVRVALAYALSLVLCGGAQQAIMATQGESNTSFAVVPLAGCVALITLVFGIVFWRRRTVRAIGWSAAVLLIVMLIFAVTVSALGMYDHRPGIGGNIGYLIAMLVVFYFTIPAAFSVPVHWFVLRNAVTPRALSNS